MKTQQFNKAERGYRRVALGLFAVAALLTVAIVRLVTDTGAAPVRAAEVAPAAVAAEVAPVAPVEVCPVTPAPEVAPDLPAKDAPETLVSAEDRRPAEVKPAVAAV
jgi:hypothetical protein